MNSASKQKDLAIELELQQKKIQLQNAENLKIILEQGLPMFERFITLKIEKVDSPKFTLSTMVFGILLFSTIVSVSVLAAWGVVSSESFGFLMGVIVGYIMTHLREVVGLVNE